MRQMPLVAVFEPHSGQVRTDTPCAEQMRHVVGIFTGFAHRSPAARLTGHRPHVLGMAVPTALAQIDEPASVLQGRVVGSRRLHPLELPDIVADHSGDVVGGRRGFEEGQYTLGDQGEEEEAHPGHECDHARVHRASSPAAAGVKSFGVRLAASKPIALSDLLSAVIMRLMIRSVIPTSIEIPARVRTSQYARICTTVSTHSAAFIHWKPCCRPAALSTMPMVEMPTVISQNDQLPSLNDHSSRPHMRGQT